MGCPRCASDRLKSAQVPLVSLAMMVIGRHRYRCADCAWTGWKHRLRRRSNTVGATLQQRQKPKQTELGVFTMVVGTMLVTAVILTRSCSGALLS